MKLEGAKVAVVGMARSGIAALELLWRHGAEIRAVDQNPEPILIGGERILVQPQTGAAFEGVDLVVLSPGVAPDLPVIDDVRHRGVAIVGDLELASWFIKGPTIGITGSNGKTTTTALTGHILKSAGVRAQVGGNIGQAPASLVDSSTDSQWNVLELSSFQLETSFTFRANIGAILNVTPDHLDRHYTMERYAAAKGRLFANQTTADSAVLNADDSVCKQYTTRGTRNWFSLTQSCEHGACLQDRSVLLDGKHLIDLNDIPLRGLHNVENVMAASFIAHLVGVPLTHIRQAITQFKAVEHRLEFVRRRNGVDWYNDSKATNVDATLKAISAFDGKLWVILGGKDKNGNYAELAEPLRAKAHAAVLIGAAANKIEDQLRGAVSFIPADTLGNAIAILARKAQPGDTVLLAPACASFDQFENFEHRGREFKRLVNELRSE